MAWLHWRLHQYEGAQGVVRNGGTQRNATLRNSAQQPRPPCLTATLTANWLSGQFGFSYESFYGFHKRVSSEVSIETASDPPLWMRGFSHGFN
jgi:hypothetical protein